MEQVIKVEEVAGAASGLSDVLGAGLYDKAVRLEGLAASLCLLSCETISCGNFRDAQQLAWSYECLAELANSLANELSDAAP